MRQIKKYLLTALILIGAIIGALFITIMAVGTFFVFRIVQDQKKNTYTLQVHSEDRLVKGIYIPSRHRLHTDRISLTLNGEAFQECQLILTTSGRNATIWEGYSSSRKIWIPKGEIEASNLWFDSYNDENISVVVRAVNNEQEPIGNLQISVAYPTSILQLILPD